jgi:hypothetical protein
LTLCQVLQIIPISSSLPGVVDAETPLTYDRAAEIRPQNAIGSQRLTRAGQHSEIYYKIGDIGIGYIGK